MAAARLVGLVREAIFNMKSGFKDVSFLLKDAKGKGIKVYGHDLHDLGIRYNDDLIVLKRLLQDVQIRIGNTAFPALAKRIQDFLEKIT